MRHEFFPFRLFLKFQYFTVFKTGNFKTQQSVFLPECDFPSVGGADYLPYFILSSQTDRQVDAEQRDIREFLLMPRSRESDVVLFSKVISVEFGRFSDSVTNGGR